MLASPGRPGEDRVPHCTIMSDRSPRAQSPSTASTYRTAVPVHGRERSIRHTGVRGLSAVLDDPESSDHLVLTDYTDATPDRGNLARVREDGSEVWRVVPAIRSQDSWTVARIENGSCRASTWSGWDVALALGTGRELARVFTK
jgi:hypothetical protein